MIKVEFVGAERLLELAHGPELILVTSKTTGVMVLRICVQAARANLGPVSTGLLVKKLEQFPLKKGKVYLIDPDYNLLETSDSCESNQSVVQIVI